VRRRDESFDRRPVEAAHRNTGSRIVITVDADHVLSLAANAVFRSKQPHGTNPDVDHPIDHVRQIRRHAGGVTQKAHPTPGQQIPALG